MLAVASRLGPYEIVAPLGVGGMGEVYRAHDTRLGREVAVKVLRDLFANDPHRQARFEREARAVAALSHPNILSIHDYGTHETITYAVMELLEGETLRGRLAQGPLAWREAVEVGAAIAEGLAAAHAKGIVHRDLKPENLFLTADGRVKILDFGLARMTATPSSQFETDAYVSAETAIGAVMGTVGYMSPEQVRGQPADAPSDLFSLGCVLYEMVTGRRAFHRETGAETMTAILHDEPSDPTTSGMQIPAELGRLIRQCLAKNPRQRLQSARDLSLGLRATATDPSLHRPTLTRLRSRLFVGFGAALLLIGVIATTAYFLSRGGKPSDPGKSPEEAKAIDALAVLPFVYTGGDPKLEMLSETLPEHISECLRQVGRRDLKIRPPSSVSRYARQRPDTVTIGQELKVPLIVTGILRQQGDDLTITVEVVDARADNLLWRSKPYLGKRGETLDLDLQDQIVQDVAANSGLRFSDEEQRRLTRRRTADKEAYNLYRQGQYHRSKFTAAGLKTSIEYGEGAIKRDPNYARAHVGLAWSYILVGTMHQGPRVTFPEARKHVAIALKIDDSLPDAHAALGITYLFDDWNWAAAERELKQAIESDPSESRSRSMYGFYLAAMDRLPEALASIQRGQELDPLAAPRRNEVAMCYNWMCQPDQAIAEAKKSLELDPKFFLAFAELGRAYAQKKMYDEAIAAMKGQGHPRICGVLGYVYAVAGRKGDAQKELDELKGMPQRRFGDAFAMARIYAALGETNEAFEWLSRACDERDPLVIWLKVDPTLENLRLDPRFAQVLKDMGLPP